MKHQKSKSLLGRAATKIIAPFIMAVAFSMTFSFVSPTIVRGSFFPGRQTPKTNRIFEPNEALMADSSRTVEAGNLSSDVYNASLNRPDLPVLTEVQVSTGDSIEQPESDEPDDQISMLSSTEWVEVPTLEVFTNQLRDEGNIGIWAEGFFAYRVVFGAWGFVPGQNNTASYASKDEFGGFFIHSYLGGDRLYRVPKWTRVAVIWADQIEWYLIDGAVRYQGTAIRRHCGYTAPYHPWGEGNLGGLSTSQLLKRHYSKPFLIQTSICADGKVGVHILTGTWSSP